MEEEERIKVENIALDEEENIMTTKEEITVVIVVVQQDFETEKKAQG